MAESNKIVKEIIKIIDKRLKEINESDGWIINRYYDNPHRAVFDELYKLKIIISKLEGGDSND